MRAGLPVKYKKARPRKFETSNHENTNMAREKQKAKIAGIRLEPPLDKRIGTRRYRFLRVFSFCCMSALMLACTRFKKSCPLGGLIVRRIVRRLLTRRLLTRSYYWSSNLQDKHSDDVQIPEQALIEHPVAHNDDENMDSVQVLQDLQVDPVLTEPDQLTQRRSFVRNKMIVFDVILWNGVILIHNRMVEFRWNIRPSNHLAQIDNSI